MDKKELRDLTKIELIKELGIRDNLIKNLLKELEEIRSFVK